MLTHKKTTWNRKWHTPEELQQAVDNYFNECKKMERPLTIIGLALALGTNRQTLLIYEGRVKGREKGEEYAEIIKKAKLMCENFAEESLFTGKNVVGPIFNLKHNYGWREKSEMNIGSNITKVKVEIVKPEENDSTDK